MLANSKTCAVVGLDGFIVEVEVDISPGLPAFKVGATGFDADGTTFTDTRMMCSPSG